MVKKHISEMAGTFEIAGVQDPTGHDIFNNVILNC